MTEQPAKAKFSAIKTAYVALFAALIAVCSWISVPTVVPFTMQTFAVYVAAALLGGKLAALCIALYMALGAVGVPVFAGFRGGVGVLVGATGGYIWGFLALALILGLCTKFIKNRRIATAVGMLLGTAVCYLFGTVWYVLFYNGGKAFSAALMLCVVPFILPDLLKMALALFVSERVHPHLKGL